MSHSEIAYLALGLALGVALGAVVAASLRGRPLRRPEVRLTITPNAIPASRVRTLAVPQGAPHPGPIPDSPDPGASPDEVPPATRAPAARVAPAAMPAAARTPVPSSPSRGPASDVAVAVGPGLAGGRPRATPGGAVEPALARARDSDVAAGAPAVAVLARPHPGVALEAPPVMRPVAGAGDLPDPGRALPAAATLVRPRAPVEVPRPSLAPGAIPVRIRGGDGARSPRARVEAIRVSLPETRPAGAPGPAADPAAARPSSAAGRASVPGNDPVAPTLRPAARGAPGGMRLEGPPGAATPAAGPDTGPCAAPRRAVEERCALAAAAREQADAAVQALREAQRAYDALRERVDRAESLADPRHVADEKDRLHLAFRAASDRAPGPEATEAAARAWLDDVNRLNASVRDARRVVESGGAELRAAHPALERLSAQSDAARIAAESAESGCREAREELAACEEAAARSPRAPSPDEPHPFEGVWPTDPPDLAEPVRAPADRLAGLPAVVRILRGDREARERLVAGLAAADPTVERGDWQLRVSRLVDAIIGRAIEDGYLDLPADDPFWRLFEPRESRDIVGALSALGFRYDGLGGFADGRVPVARDLSLAVGYAGLDRMRIRTWPRESDIAALYARAVVAADEWLADQAGDLSLGRMVEALGGRAAELADVWNAWGRVRPALLAS